MNYRFFTLLIVCFLLVGQSPAWAKKRSRKKDRTEQADSSKVKPSKYRKTFSAAKGCVTAQGPFLTLHKVSGKLYIEVPREYLGRELLIAATVTGTSDTDVATIGYKARVPFHGRFIERDSSIFLEKIAVLPDLESPDSTNDRNLPLTNLAPTVWGGEIFCESDDKQHVVFDATSLFRNLDDLSPLGTRSAMGLSIKASCNSPE